MNMSISPTMLSEYGISIASNDAFDFDDSDFEDVNSVWDFESVLTAGTDIADLMAFTEDVEAASTELKSCSICGRTFRPDVLEKHERICLKAKTNPRKAFDSRKKRLEGTEAETVTPKSNSVAEKKVIKSRSSTPTARRAIPPSSLPLHAPSSHGGGHSFTPARSPSLHSNSTAASSTLSDAQARKANWKDKHEELIRTIRAARGEPEDDDFEPELQEPKAKKVEPKSRVPAGYEECPSCGRNFSHRAAERHIAWCTEKQKLPQSPAPASTEAVERLKARTQYKVPLPKKASPNGVSGLLQRKKATNGPTLGRKSPRQATTPTSLSAPTHTQLERQRTRSSPSMLDDDGHSKVFHKNTTSQHTTNTSPRKVAKSRVSELMHPPSKKPPTSRPVMKFKEKFPNRPSVYEDGYDPYLVADMQLRELHKTNNLVNSRSPRTVPGVRTGSLNNVHEVHSINDDEMNYLNAKFSDLNRPSEFTNNWTKRDIAAVGAAPSTILPDVMVASTPNVGYNGLQNGSYFATPPAMHRSYAGNSDGEIPTSSSSSDGSLPTLSRNGSSGTDSRIRLAPVCHQCNTPYTAGSAKFCSECGARRIGVIGMYAPNNNTALATS